MRLHTAHLKPESMESVRELVAAHPGKCPLFLCFMRPTGEVVFMETKRAFCRHAVARIAAAADELFGEETYYAKVDMTLPEKQQRLGTQDRSWQRRGIRARCAPALKKEAVSSDTSHPPA